MITKQETEKLFMYCFEELRRMTLWKKDYLLLETYLNYYINKFYQKRDESKMSTQTKNTTSCSILEVSHKLNDTSNSKMNYLNKEKIKQQRIVYGWFTPNEESIVLLIRLFCLIFCLAFWYGAYRLFKIFFL